MLVEIRVKFGQGLAEFCDFLAGAMHFHPNEFRDSEAFFDAGTDIFEVSQQSGGTGVGFPAEDDVSADGEIVVEAGFFCRGACDEAVHQFLEGLEFSLLDAKIGMNADGV